MFNLHFNNWWVLSIVTAPNYFLYVQRSLKLNGTSLSDEACMPQSLVRNNYHYTIPWFLGRGLNHCVM
jgi:hypothetical protein